MTHYGQMLLSTWANRAPALASWARFILSAFSSYFFLSLLAKWTFHLWLGAPENVRPANASRATITDSLAQVAAQPSIGPGVGVAAIFRAAARISASGGGGPHASEISSHSE